MDEILRALDALQVAAANKVALPLDWKRGDKVIIPPPKTMEEMAARKVDFYLCKKELDLN